VFVNRRKNGTRLLPSPAFSFNRAQQQYAVVVHQNFAESLDRFGSGLRRFRSCAPLARLTTWQSGEAWLDSFRLGSHRDLIWKCRLQLGSRVSMVQSAEPGRGQYLASNGRASGDGPTRRRVLRQSEMRTVLMIIADVLSHQPLQLPTQRSATPFCHGLRKAVRTGRLPISRVNDTTSLPNLESRSNSRNLWAAV
jgi:hypothetical protein